eukprot:TRINITY_DN6685_c0_g1_i1.p1 TRINITY_DN6685_c0_g1~~TRINITY_DN6685_c0_g1_i1.p1  ORF type:complete len:485 (-),score=68.68 TRINITY_DN6685_c0_g1_i1:54-1508(-)
MFGAIKHVGIRSMRHLGQKSSRSLTTRISRSQIVDILKRPSVGEKIEVKGWVKTLRTKKTVSFIELNDGSTINNLQVVVDPAKLQQHISTGSCVSVEGVITKPEHAEQNIELQCENVTLIGPADQTYPISKKRHTFDYLREIAHLRPRTNTFGAVMRVRNRAQMAVHNFFQQEGFAMIHTPIITSNDCEGNGELFTLTTPYDKEIKSHSKNNDNKPENYSHFFNCPDAYLTVSGQLHAEMFAAALGRVYTFGPTFRAETSNTTRHLSEFWMIEPEASFFDLNNNMKLAEGFVKYCIKDLLEHCKDDLEFFNERIDTKLLEKLKYVLNTEFGRIDYTEAVDVLKKNGLEITWGDDLSRKHEQFICEEYVKKPVFVINYPKSLKPFYMKANPDGKTVAAMDLIIPHVGELIGGSQREENHEILLQRMQEMKMNVDNYQWYLDLRKYGTAPNSGFGMGFERFLMFVTGMENIRDLIPIPRAKGYCKF